MSGKLLRSAVVVCVAAGFTVLSSAGALAGATRGDQGKRPKLIVDGRVVQRADRIAPGDRVVRTLVFHVRGHGRLEVVQLRVEARRKSLLTDRANGLRLSLERCSRRWERRAGVRPFRCRGHRSTLLKEVPVLGARRLRGLFLRPGARAYIRLTLTLPAAAGNALQNQRSTLVYRFTGVARPHG